MGLAGQFSKVELVPIFFQEILRDGVFELLQVARFLSRGSRSNFLPRFLDGSIATLLEVLDERSLIVFFFFLINNFFFFLIN